MSKAKPTPNNLRLMLLFVTPALLLVVAQLTYIAITRGVDINDFFWTVTLIGLVPILILATAATAWQMRYLDKKQSQSKS